MSTRDTPASPESRPPPAAIEGTLLIVSGDYAASFTLSRHFLLRLRERFFPEGLPHPRDLRSSIKSARIVDARHGAVGHILNHRIVKSLYLVNEKDDAIYVLEQSRDGRFRVLRTCYRKSESDWIVDALWQARRQRTETVAERIAEGAEAGTFDVRAKPPEAHGGNAWALAAVYWSADGSPKTKNLGSVVPLAPTPDDLDAECRRSLIASVRERLAAKAIPEDRVVEVWVKVGKKGTRTGVWSNRH